MIHQYQLNGYNIVLDINSGGVHVVDELTYEMIAMLTPPLHAICPPQVMEAFADRYDTKTIKEAYNDVFTLYENDILFSDDEYEQFSDMMVSSPVKAMCLHVAHDCNLRCSYCFASTGDFGAGRKLLDAETGKKAIDFLLTRSGSRRNLELDFFGGEPLMNFEVVREIVSYARIEEKKYNKNFRFTITTNGMLLNDNIIDYINQEMSNVVLSIDGRKEVNDRVRVRCDGTGSYDKIVPNYQRLVEKRGQDQYYVRGTFTKYNLDFAKDVMHLNELGFDQVSVEPAVADPKVPYALTEGDLPRIYAEYEELAKQLIAKRKKGEGFNFFHFMLDLDQGPCAIKRLRGCGCGNEYVAVTPDGDIYPCHQFVGMEEWKMGSVLDDSFDLKKKGYFAKANIYGKDGCKDCWAKFYCSGGCNANNFQYAGDVLKPHKLSCELEKKRLECAIMMKAALAEEEEA